MAGVTDVINACRCVPGEKEFTFAIAVVREEVAGRVKVKVIGIAEAVGDDFSLPAIGRETQERSALGIAYGRMRQGHVLAVDAAVIAADEIPPAVGPLAHGVAPMLG